MKRMLLLLSLGLIGTLAVLKAMNQGKQEPGLAEETDKNFGAFPPDIPAAQFDEMFV
jgi:hypothetical protein